MARGRFVFYQHENIRLRQHAHSCLVNALNIAWPSGTKASTGCGVRKRMMMQRVCGFDIRGVRHGTHESCNDAPHRNTQAHTAAR